MKITIPYRHTVDVVPPRCRKPRGVQRDGATTVSIHEVSSAEAPVAIVQSARVVFNGDRRRTEYRWWDGRLWILDRFQRSCGARYESQRAAQFRADPWPQRFTLGAYPDDSHQPRAYHQRRLRRFARRHLFINGWRYKEADEPRYVVMTFGLGHNHGGWGTCLSTDNGYNVNIGRDCYFRCDQYAEAEAAAERTARARDDTKALPIKHQRPDRFEIQIPEAVRLHPAREHGPGNAFMNSLEAMVEGSPDSLSAGLGVMALGLREIASETQED